MSRQKTFGWHCNATVRSSSVSSIYKISVSRCCWFNWIAGFTRTQRSFFLFERLMSPQRFIQVVTISIVAFAGPVVPAVQLLEQQGGSSSYQTLAPASANSAGRPRLSRCCYSAGSQPQFVTLWRKDLTSVAVTDTSQVFFGWLVSCESRP
jgi:hypothetical protein